MISLIFFINILSVNAFYSRSNIIPTYETNIFNISNNLTECKQLCTDNYNCTGFIQNDNYCIGLKDYSDSTVLTNNYFYKKLYCHNNCDSRLFVMNTDGERCFCDSRCINLNDCCSDYEDYCITDEPTMAPTLAPTTVTSTTTTGTDTTITLTTTSNTDTTVTLTTSTNTATTVTLTTSTNTDTTVTLTTSTNTATTITNTGTTVTNTGTTVTDTTVTDTTVTNTGTTVTDTTVTDTTVTDTTVTNTGTTVTDTTITGTTVTNTGTTVTDTTMTETTVTNTGTTVTDTTLTGTTVTNTNLTVPDSTVTNTTNTTNTTKTTTTTTTTTINNSSIISKHNYKERRFLPIYIFLGLIFLVILYLMIYLNCINNKVEPIVENTPQVSACDSDDTLDETNNGFNDFTYQNNTYDEVNVQKENSRIQNNLTYASTTDRVFINQVYAEPDGGTPTHFY